MPRTRYRRQPEQWYCIQYNGSNQQELINEYPPHVTYDTKENRLMMDGMYIVEKDSWVMQDNYGLTTQMTNDRFNAYFELNP